MMKNSRCTRYYKVEIALKCVHLEYYLKIEPFEKKMFFG